MIVLIVALALVAAALIGLLIMPTWRPSDREIADAIFHDALQRVLDREVRQFREEAALEEAKIREAVHRKRVLTVGNYLNRDTVDAGETGKEPVETGDKSNSK